MTPNHRFDASSPAHEAVNDTGTPLVTDTGLGVTLALPAARVLVVNSPAAATSPR